MMTVDRIEGREYILFQSSREVGTGDEDYNY